MTATMPTSTQLRPCRLYRFYVAHPVTGERVLGYIGETWQMPFDRLMQHVRDQPWADTILGWEVDPVVYYGKAAVLEAERLAVEAERPLYNYEHNLSNPDRVEIWRAKEQRWARDDAAGVRRWRPPVKKPRNAPARPAAQTTRTDRSCPAWLVKAGLWSTAWALTAVMLWAALWHYGVTVSWTQRWIVAGVVPPTLLGWALWREPDTVRLWRERACTVWRLLRRIIRAVSP